MGLSTIQKELRLHQCEVTAQRSMGFFKTGEGEYSFGDIFIGVKTPTIRALVKKNPDISLSKIVVLIRSKVHEDRLLGLLLLVQSYENSKCPLHHEKVFQQYLKLFKYVNNWDLVDLSCPRIVGRHLLHKKKIQLVEWAKSDHLWTRRIAIVSHWWFIRHGDLKSVFKVSKLLLHDQHDLIHKAVGWMLREVYKKDKDLCERYLLKHYKQMPRTMLRYAIERVPENRRQKYLKGKL